MNRYPRNLLVVIVAGVLAVPLGWSIAAAQSADARQAQATSPAPAAPAAAPQRELPPATKALNEASAIKDIDQKIDAIRKVIADFPKAPQVSQANTLLLSALIKKGDADAVRVQAKVIVDGADEASGSRLRRDVASALLTGDLLLDEAETYARAAVDLLPDEKTYVEARKKEAAARAASRAAQGASGSGASAAGAAPSGGGGVVGVTPAGAVASDDSLFVSRYKSEKQSALSALGQVYAKRGKAADAEKTLREAYLVDSKTAAAATAAVKLAEYAKAAGRDEEQFEYLAGVAIAGRLTPEARADLQSVYQKLHKGSLAGLDAELDARYEKDGPKPPAVPKYERAADRTDRVVLGEVFTGSGCPPCVAADLAFESAMHRYGTADLAVLMYHLHIPRPDPMTNPTTQARARFYGVNAVPTFAIDGKTKTGGGGAEAAQRVYKSDVESVVDKRLATASSATVGLKGTMQGQSVRASVNVSGTPAAAAHLRLHIALVEEQVRYSGENGVRFHPMVVRAMAVDPMAPAAAPAKPTAAPAKPTAAQPADQPAQDETPKAPAKETVPVPVLGFALEAGKAATFECAFDLAKVAADGLANLQDLEKNSTRFPNYKFAEKKNDVDAKRLALVAFVQDEDSKEILQASYLALGASAGKGK